MADSKKYDGSQWEHSLRKLTTATEAVENPLYSDGTAITSYTIKGNTVQNGTPSQGNPVDVNGVGVRTENLWDENYTGITTAVTYKPIYVGSGTFTLSTNTPRTGGGVANLFLLAGNVSSGGSTANDGVWSGQDRTVTAIDGYVTIIYRNLDDTNPADYHTMLNSGSTAKPYEPYGYKIPILNGQQSIDIYIGDLPLLKSFDGTAVDEISNGTLTRRVDSDGSVLPTPTTTQITMPSIPTTEGANSITVDTTVQPSEFAATWTGWHNASVKEKSENLWNEDYTNISSDIYYKPVYVGDYEIVTVSSTVPLTSQNFANLFAFGGQQSSGASTNYNGVYSGRPMTLRPVDGYITIAYRNTNGVNPQDYDTMVNEGRTVLPYEPYWK